MDALSSFINRETENRGWTVTELARKAELAQPTVADVLNGKKRPGLRFYLGVARALGCSVDHLLRLAGELPASVGKVDELNEEEAEIIKLYRRCALLHRQTIGDMLRTLAAFRDE
jgi:transcriptional regulator with XRE-family HTH domain